MIEILSSSIVVGAVLVLWDNGRKRRRVLIMAIVATILLGTGPVAFLLLGSLEFQYEPLQAEKDRSIRSIVILAGYAESDARRPLSSQINRASSFRLIEALHLHSIYNDATLIISGWGRVPEVMKEVLIKAGMPEQGIQIDNQSANTFESARNVQRLLPGGPFILVTSAGHMPRSMLAFKQLGATPVAAPTDFLTKWNPLAVSYIPSFRYLEISEYAAHEYLGLLWYRLSGRI